MTTRTPAGSAPHLDAAASLSHCLHSLLSSVRCIAQHEDAICELLHESRHNPASSRLAAQLHSLLDDLPAHEYLYDLEAVRDILGQPRLASKSRSRSSAKASAGKQRTQAVANNRRGSAKSKTASRKIRRKPSR